MSGTRFPADAARALIRERHFDEVIDLAENFIAHPNAVTEDKRTALHLIGTCNYLQGKLPKAIECFQRVLNEDPKHTDSAISLSIIYNDIGKYDEAKKIYQAANQSLQLKREGTDAMLDRKFALKHIEIGDLYVKYHRYDDALEDYSRATRLDPQDFDIRIKMAKVYAKKGFTSRSIQELQQLCNEQHDYLPARIHLGLMYFSLGNVIDAQLEWEKARAQDPSNPEVQTYLEMARTATETSV